MPIELSQLMQLFAGQKPSLQVGELPRPVAAHLRCSPGVVYLGHNEFRKIVGKHTEVCVADVQLLHDAVRNGRYYSDEQGRSNCATIIHERGSEEMAFLVGLKVAEKGGEVWVSTYHRIGKRRLGRRLKRAKLLLDASK